MSKHVGCAIIVFAKIPGSPVKTRIAVTEGNQTAQQIYIELLCATAHALRSCDFHVAYANDAEPGELTRIFANAQSFFPQVTGSLGARLFSACEKFSLNGYQKFCVIGTDCPHINEIDIYNTSNALSGGYDVVIGPAEDGGYYLAGVNKKGMRIFNAQNWSTPDLLRETLSIASANNLKTTLIESKSDIDTISDYNRWKII